jgi:hypothetical protein
MMADSLPSVIVFHVSVWQQVEALQLAVGGWVWIGVNMNWFNLSILVSTLALKLNPSIFIQSRFYGSIPVSWFISSFKVQSQYLDSAPVL